MKIFKRAATVAVLAIAVFSLGACNLFLDLMGVRYPKPVSFEQRVAEHETLDEAAIYAKLSELETLSQDSRNANQLTQGYVDLNWMIADVQSYYILAMLNYYGDTTNAAYQAQAEHMTTFLNTLQNDLLETEKVLCESPCRSAMEQLLGADYVEYVLTEDVLPEEVMNLVNQASSLANEYSAIWTDSTLTEEEKATEAKELYVELVGIRNGIAAALEWENYAEYSYANEYYRDYLPEDAAVLAENVRKYLSPLYGTVYNAYVRNAPSGLRVTEEDLLRILTDYAPRISGGFKSSVNHMKKYNLYDFKVSATKANTSFCISWAEYGDAYMFLNASGDYSDISTAIHEMGHYNSMLNSDSSKSQTFTQSIDLSEIHSQANELLFLELYPQFLEEKYVKGMQAYTYVNSIYAALTGCMVDELERYAYTEENLTVEKMDQKFAELKASYGIDPGWNWYDVPHIYESPCYYISYASSQIAALEIWSLSKSDRSKALSVYEEIVSYGSNNDFLSVLLLCNLDSPFQMQTVRAIADNLSREFAAQGWTAA